MIREADIVLPYGVIKGDIAIEGEKISALGNVPGRAKKEIIASGMLAFPGFIDAHVHFSLPVSGTRTADDFASGSLSALFGGVTTFIDFTVSAFGGTLAENIEARLSEARESVADYTFHAEITSWNRKKSWEIESAIEKGITSFKFFMTYEDSGRRTDKGKLYHAFSEIAKLGGVALVHAEDEELVKYFTDLLIEKGKLNVRLFPKSRPPIVEAMAIEDALFLARETGVNLYVVHVSTAAGAEIIEKGKMEGITVYAETAPHYLILTEGDFSELVSMCPPLRRREDSIALWEFLSKGVLSVVATDHCSFSPAQKKSSKDFRNVPMGIPGVETLFPLLFTHGYANGKLSLVKLSEILSANPAKIFGLYPRKGVLSVGSDADIVLVDPSREVKLKASCFHSNAGYTPYEGMELKGFPNIVISRGEVVIEEERFLGNRGRGKFLKREVSRS